MRKSVLLGITFFVFALTLIFMSPQPAEAVFYGINNTAVFSSVNFSPNPPTTKRQFFSGSSQPTPIYITDVTVSQSGGSVFIGGGEKNNAGQPNVWPEATSQPIGIYGAGVPLAPLGDGICTYNLKFDYHFRTWDSSSYDTFEAIITQGGYAWAGGTTVGGFIWGGSDRGGLETNDYPIPPNPVSIVSTVYVTPASDYYLNFLLRTTSDTTEPSWGRFSDCRVEGIVPEPATLSLLGLGLISLIGRRFLKRKL